MREWVISKCPAAYSYSESYLFFFFALNMQSEIDDTLVEKTSSANYRSIDP